jgi:transposase-like protein
MLRYFGKLYCPHCETDLAHDYDQGGDPVLDIPQGEGRWVCRSCGYSRPVVYSIDRRRGAPSLVARIRQTLRAV